MPALIVRTIVISALLVGMSLAQETPKQSAQPAFHVQTDLVVVPFEVRRGSRPVSDLKPSDVVLLEDGVPRAFSAFEPPPDHPALELVVMFDVTDRSQGGFWDTEALHHLASFWTDARTQAFFEEREAAIRISVYQFNQSRLRRLHRSTSDPKVLREALRRLSEPIPADEALAFSVPAGTVIRLEQKAADQSRFGAWSFSLAGAMTALRDSAVDTAKAARTLVVFSTGAEGTSVTPQDLVDQALAADVHVYPVVLPSLHPIWYDGYGSPMTPTGISRDGGASPSGLLDGLGRPRWPQNGICPDLEFRGAPPTRESLHDCALNVPLANVGKQTGGRSFEAKRLPPADPISIDRFSMTGTQVREILDAVRDHALSRFSSTYRLSFSPASSASPRKHTLEVKLATKSRGKVTGGKKSASY